MLLVDGFRLTTTLIKANHAPPPNNTTRLDERRATC